MGAGLALALALQGCSLPREIDPKFSMDPEVLVLDSRGEFIRKSPPLGGNPVDIEWRSDGTAVVAVDGAGLTIFDPETGKIGDYFGPKSMIEMDVLDGREVLGVNPMYMTVSYFEPTAKLLDENGAVLREIPVPLGVHDIDLLPNGNFLRVDAKMNRVVEVTPEGQIVWQSTVPLLNPYEAILTDKDTIVIANFDRHRVVEITRDNQIVSDLSGFNHPRRIQKVSEGYYVVADADLRRVDAITPGGQMFAMAEGLNQPWSVAYDPIRQIMLVGAVKFFNPPDEAKIASAQRYWGYGFSIGLWLISAAAVIAGYAGFRAYRESLTDRAQRVCRAMSGWIEHASMAILAAGCVLCVTAAYCFTFQAPWIVRLGLGVLGAGLAAAWLSRYRREWWFSTALPRMEDEEPADEADDASRAVIRPGLMIAGLLICWFVFIWTRSWPAQWWPVALWALGPLMCVFAVRKTYRQPFNGINWLWMAGVLAIALFFRLYQIEKIPYGLWLDEVYAVSNALLNAENGTLRPFETVPLVRPHEFDVSNLYLLAIVLVKWAFGMSFLVVKWISIAPSLGIVIGVYLLGKWSFNDWAGRIAALIVAVNSWQVTFARWGWLQQLYVMLAILTLAFFIRAYRWKCARSAAWSGLCLGLGFFTYVPIVLTTATLAALWGVSLFEENRRFRLKQIVLTALIAAVTFAPLWAYYVKHPGTFMARTSSAGITNDVFNARSFKPLTNNIHDYLLAFTWHGDRNTRHNIPGKPMLDPFTGGLMLAGLLLAAYRFYRPGERLVLLSIALAMTGGVLSMAAETPNTFRLGVTGPLMCLLAALPLASLLDQRERRAENDSPSLWPALFAAALMMAMAGAGYYRYFIQYPSAETWPASYGADQHLAYEHLTKDDVGRDRLIVHPRYANKTFDLYMYFLELRNPERRDAVLKEQTRYQVMDVKQAVPPAPAGGMTLLMPADYDGVLREKFPNIEIEELNTPYGDKNAVIGRIGSAG